MTKQENLEALFDSLPAEQTNNITEDDINLELKKEELASRVQDRRQRGIFSKWIFGFMAIYMLGILAILVLVGCGVLSLSDTVLVALLTTTTAEVIGIFIVVAKYLFHKADSWNEATINYSTLKSNFVGMQA